MKKINLLLIFILITCCHSAFSQSFEVPENYVFKVAADYSKYEQAVIAGAKWLKETPFNEQAEKRKAVSKFLITWINGSPTVNVELNSFIMDFDKKNEGMLALFMSACARYVLENNYSKDMRAKHRAALRDIIAVYKSGNGIKKDKKMEKLIKSEEEGKIDEWLEENLKINQ
jgi:hypothetical protein